jgi:RimJ/RimL family protein N-acetyltransferase
MQNWENEVTLDGDLVKLVPLQLQHRDELVNAAADGELWDLWFTSVPSEKNIDTYLNTAIAEKSNYKAIPFAVIEKSSGRIIGTTRFCNIKQEYRRLEIGYTWYAKSTQRTGVNTECKYLMLSYAFEQLNCIAVEFRTNWHNKPSRNAIERIGAKQDGILRNHIIMANGIYRDTVVFSIIENEWKSVKRNLEYMINKFKKSY